jgi:hypothetical protein
MNHKIGLNAVCQALFVVHIMTLPVLQIILSQITGYLINGYLERTLIEAIAAYFKVLGLFLPRRYEENY